MSMNFRSILTGMLREITGTQKISQNDLDRICQEIEKKVQDEPPPKFAFMGKTGVGKSSTLNALFNAGLKISHTKACTQEAKGLEIKSDEMSGRNGAFIVYDMPGLGESRAKQPQHLRIYEKVLKDVDVALWIMDAHDREMESVQRNLEDNLRNMNEALIKNMVIALNKFDLLHPLDWHPDANMPSEKQEEHMRERVEDVSMKIREVIPDWNGKVIGYSAEKRYNLPQLFAVILDSVPIKRQWIVASRKAIADFLDFVDPNLLLTKETGENQSIFKHHYSDKVSDIIGKMNQDEFQKIASDPIALQRWLASRGL